VSIISHKWYDELVGWGGRAEKILEKILEFQIDIPPKNRIRRNFKGIQVYLLSSNSKHALLSSSSRIESIKILGKFQNVIRNAKLIERSKNLILQLVFLNSILVSYINCQKEGLELGNPNFSEKSREEILEWFSVQLFKPHGSLPVFGMIENFDQPLDKEQFGEVQSLLINYFSSPLSHKKLTQVTIFLIGYWYKNDHSNQWNKLFSNDDSFWHTMIKSFSQTKTIFTKLRSKKSSNDKRKEDQSTSIEKNVKKRKTT
jgi:hypothetical protein